VRSSSISVALFSLVFAVAACDEMETSLGSTSALAGQPPEVTTILTFTFDDAQDSQLLGAEILEGDASTPPEDSYRGTFFIISGRLRRADDDPDQGHMSPGDVQALAAAGHEIGGHSVNHVLLSELAETDPYELRRQVCDNRRALVALGIDPVGFAYPFSGDEGVHEVVAACGYRYGRDSGGLTLTTQSGVHAETVPPLDTLKIRTLPSINAALPPGDPHGESASAAALEKWIEDVRDSGGGWLPIVIHHVRESCGDLGGCIDAPELRALVAWLRTDPPGIAVRTMDQVMLGAPLVANPSLEESNTSVSPARPLCFKRTGKTPNFPSISTPAPGHTGNYAEVLRPTSSVPGPMIGIDQTGRGCPLPVRPGRHYDVRARARAVQPPSAPTSASGTARASLVVSVQIDETWVTFATGPAVSVGSGWARLSFVTPPVPAGATAMTFAVQYAGSTGSTPDLHVDGFSLVER
jgi:polysaccharide deacetylase